MSENIEELKKKIIYRASYRGTKEMDILMYNFVNSLINDLKFMINIPLMIFNQN